MATTSTATFSDGTGDIRLSGTISMGSFTGGGTFDTLHVTGATTLDGDLAHKGTKLGFYNTAAISQQTGVAVTAAGIHAACVALGLFTA